MPTAGDQINPFVLTTRETTMTSPSLLQTFGGEFGFGEDSVSRNDDGSSPEIDITPIFENGLNFFGVSYDSLWINTNGSVTFNGSLSSFTPQTISGGTVPGVFAFWGDVDTRDATEENTSPGGNSQGTNLVWYDFDEANDRFVVTWDDVGFYSHNNSRVNAFQLILTDMSSSVGRAPGDFNIDFRYEWIDWTTGNASGGSGGLGGTPARAGYSAGDAAGTFFELPQSGIQDEILALETTAGNTGVDGLWRFEVRNGDVPQTVTLFDGFDIEEGDSGVSILEFMIERSGNTAGELTLDWAAAGTAPWPANDADVVGPLPTSGTVTFAEGESTAFVMLEVNGDTIVEPDESVRVTLSNPVSTGAAQVVLGRSAATGTILDDDALPPPPPPSITSWFWGDPHLITLDGLGYDFQAVGEFTLVESTAGDPLNIQVRTVPVGEVVSVITVMATEVDGHRVVIDATSDTPLTIDGVATTVTAVGGPVDVGTGQIFEQDGMLIVVYPSGEQARVNFADSQDFINVSLFLNEDRPAGSVRGLLGNLDADSTNDLALPDGTVLAQPVDFDVLYGQFADAWRITEDVALFDRAEGETTDDFQDPSFPRGVLTTADLPASVLAEATAQAQAAGITDPSLLEAAILDFALTGDSAFVNAGAAITAPPTATALPANAPALASSLLIDAPGDQPEGNAGTGTFVFTVHRIGDATAPITATYTLGGDISADDIVGELTGEIDFAADQTSATIAVAVAGDTNVEADEELVVTLGIDAMFNTTLANNGIATLILNDDESTEPVGQEITGTAGDDSLVGGDGDDTINGGDGLDTLVGGAGDDSLTGGTSTADLRDVIFGQDGDDTLDGGYGNDELRGDAGNDILRGGFGVDNLFGGTGDDNINGAAFSDLVFGGAGNDTVNGGFGFDRINGGDGADTFFHLGVPDHGSDWIQDFSHAEGDVLFFGQAGATADDFQVNFGVTGAAGSADVDEAFVVYTGGDAPLIVWALVDGAGNDGLIVEVAGGTSFDLLA